MPAGRPTDYDKKFCEQVIKLSGQGYSRYEICRELQIAMSTFTKWRDEHEAFSAAVELGDTFYKAWLFSQPKVYGLKKDFNEKAWATLMRFNCRLTTLKKAKTYQEQHGAIIDAVADCEMLPEDGSKLISAIASKIKIDEATEFKARLDNLEKSS